MIQLKSAGNILEAIDHFLWIGIISGILNCSGKNACIQRLVKSDSYCFSYGLFNILYTFVGNPSRPLLGLS